MLTLAFIGELFTPTHLLILGFVALLIFGRRLPEVGRNLGRGITEFKRGLKDVNQNMDDTGDQSGGQSQYQQPRGYVAPPPPGPTARLQSPGPGAQQQVRVSRQDMVD